MLKTQHSPIPPGSEKHHYHILDGLRGVAAIVVVWFHIFEAYATSHELGFGKHCPDEDV